MELAARQIASVLTDEWIRVDEAAVLVGESVRAWQLKAQSEAVAARNNARASRSVKRTPDDGGKPVWYVRRSLDVRLARIPSRDAREEQRRSSLITRYPQHKVEQAYRKAHWLKAWLTACESRRGGGLTEAELAERIIAEAHRCDGDDFPISFRTLQLWDRAFHTLGPDKNILGVEGLIDRRGADNGGGGAHESRSVGAVEFFYGLYHCQSKPTVRTCHEATLRKARTSAWTWPASYSATRKWLQTYDDLSLSFLMREGRDSWNRRYMAHMDLDYTLIEPGQLFVCDHHQADFWVEHNGQQLRPWLTAIQDARSRCIVGWHLGTAPHQDAILAAMRKAFSWAIPEHMRIDNGKDFTSKLLTGVTKHQRDALRRELGGDWRRLLDRDSHLADCIDPRFKGIVHELGIDLIYAMPYAAWSKGTLERFFGTFEDHCGKTFATYCGNSTMTRPECLDAIRRGYTKDQKKALRRRYGKDWKRVAVLRVVDTSAVPTLDAAREAVGEWVELYHRSEHRGDGMDGATPLTVWESAVRLRKASADALLFLMEARGVYKVGANGVRFKVGNHVLGYGANEPRLQSLRGRDVFITLDPADLSHCHAWTADAANRRHVARLASNERISPLATIDDLRDAHATIERRRKVARKAEREAPSRTRGVAAELSAQRRERLGELKATGTEGRPRMVNVQPIRTAFEGASKPVQVATEPARLERLQQVSKILFDAPAKDRGLDNGTDADRPKRADLMRLLAGNRHERTTEQ